jgi:hypothetical protein
MSRAELGFRPGRLWSLLDMIQVHAKEYLDLGARLEAARIVFMLGESEDQPPRQLDADSVEGLREDLREALRHCEQLKLPIAAALLKKNIEDPPKTRREFEAVTFVVEAELSGKLFLFVPHHLAKYYESEDLLSDNVKRRFPMASSELRNSGNCLAAGQYTACVFHSMRAAEIGLRSLGKVLNVEFPDIPLEQAEMLQIITQAESKIRKMQDEKKAK